MSLTDTTKKIKQNIGEKQIPPMLDNTFWGNKETEIKSLEKISVINKKISLIEKSIKRIVKSFISLNDGSILSLSDNNTSLSFICQSIFKSASL